MYVRIANRFSHRHWYSLAFRVFIWDPDGINTLERRKKKDGQRETSSCEIVQTVLTDPREILRLRFLFKDVLLWAKKECVSIFPTQLILECGPTLPMAWLSLKPAHWSQGNPWICVCVLRRILLFVTAWTVAHQAPLSMEFSRQEYWI